MFNKCVVSHPYFVRQNTERAAKVHFFLHLLSSSPENLPPFCDFTYKCLINLPYQHHKTP